MYVKDFKRHVYYRSPSGLTIYYFTDIIGSPISGDFEIIGWKYESQTLKWAQWQAFLFGGAIWQLDEILTFSPPCPDDPVAKAAAQIQQTMQQQLIGVPNPITHVSIPVAVDNLIKEVKENLKKLLRCECGAEKCGYNIHSDWCPKHENH